MSNELHVKYNGNWEQIDIGSPFDDFYPVGSVYISVNATLPASFKGTWEQLPNNVSLWNTTTASQLGTTLAGSMPNITGWASNRYGTLFWQVDSRLTSGAVYMTDYSSSLFSEPNATGGNSGYRSIYLDASRSNSVYNGNAGNNIVRPTSIGVTMWKRIA